MKYLHPLAMTVFLVTILLELPLAVVCNANLERQNNIQAQVTSNSDTGAESRWPDLEGTLDGS
jgi:hypothetical protein